MAKLKTKKYKFSFIFYDKKGEIITTDLKLFETSATVGDIFKYARTIRPPIAWRMEITAYK